MKQAAPIRKRNGGVGSLCFAFIVGFLLLFSTRATNAQVITGSFNGQVTDPSGAVIPQAIVTLTNQGTHDVRKTTSNQTGFFTFASVDPGTYTLAVKAQGFKSYKQTDLTLTAGDNIKISGIQMQIGSSAESVQVSADQQPLIDTDNGERSFTISQQEIERLSTESRNASELMKILPGVTSVANGTNNGLGFDFSNASSTGSTVGVGLNPNGAPYRGGTAYILDGANIIDPGCNCWSLAVINPDMAQEIKIQTSNFGADSADGPVIFSAISKSGSANYHGEAYLYARNYVLNSNDWLDNYYGTARPNDYYYYPGGNIGGPVRIPHTGFNKNDKLRFWFGYEAFRQNLGGNTTLESTIPTPGMLSGDFTLNGQGNAGVCPQGFSSAATNWCNNLAGGYAPNGTPLAGQNVSQYIDPGALALSKLWPSANADPLTHGGYNYYQLIPATHNGQVWRARVDYDINQNNKVFVAFQQGTDTASDAAHIFWNPALAVAYPGGTINNPTTSRVLTFNMVNILNPSLTNEFVFAWGYANSPYKPTDIKAAYASTVGYSYGSIFNNSLVAPSINGTWGVPDTSQPDIWSASGGQYPLKKATPSFSDNVTKVWKQHTFEAGLFTELVNNYQGNFVDYNGTYSFGSNIQADAVTGKTTGTNNPTANFLMGIANNFTQTNSEPLTNMAYRTTSGFLLDDWKVTPRFTANIGFRLDHIGRWYDRSGVGMAVWLPQLYNSDVADNPAWPYPGVRWHGVDPGIPNSGSPTDFAYTSPRLGIAYDIFGTGRTVLRGGWGLYRWNDQYNDYGGPLSTAQEMSTYSSPSNRNVTFGEISAIGASGTAAGALGGLSGVADPTDRKIPTTAAYNATVSQQMPMHTVLEVAYVGNNTANLLMGGQSAGSAIAPGFVNQNKIPLGGVFRPDPVTGAPAPADPDNLSSYNLTDYYPYYKGYGTNAINMNTHAGYSNYNALQVAWSKPIGNLTFNVNYTWQKALGMVSSTVDAFSVHGNYGVLNIDRPQVFNSSYAYTLAHPYNGDSRLISGVTNGWTISGTTTYQTGANLQAQTTQNLGLSIKDTTQGENLTSLTWFGTNTQEILPTELCNPKSHLGAEQKLNASCFGVPAIGSQGLRQFPYLSGPAYANTDLTIYKPFHVHDKQTVEIRAAAFNAFNHPLWEFNGSQYTTLSYATADKTNFTNTSTANLSTSTPVWGKMYYKAGRRIGELSVKYNF